MAEPATSKSIVLQPDLTFNAVKIFSATMMNDRSVLGERVTEWMAQNKNYTVTEIVQTQSSDSAFHCIAFSVFYRS